MLFPHPFLAGRGPVAPSAASGARGKNDEKLYARFHRKDEQWRAHALARRVALMSSKSARQEYVAQMEARLPEIKTSDRQRNEVFMRRFKRLVKWYFRAQRRLRQKQQQGAKT